MFSSTVAVNDVITASQYNNVRKDVACGGQGDPTSTGSANAQAITVDSQITAYTAGQIFRFVAGYTNIGAVTLNVNSIGAVNLYLDKVEMPAGTIRAGWTYEVIYDGGNFKILGGNTNRGPVLLSVMEWNNASGSKDTGVIDTPSQYKYYKIVISGYRNSSSGTSGRLFLTVNAIGGSAYRYMPETNPSSFSAELTSQAEFGLYRSNNTDRAITLEYMLGNIKSPVGDVEIVRCCSAMNNNGGAGPTVVFRGRVALGSDTEINKITLNPNDNGGSDNVTLVAHVYGYR